MIVYFLRGLPGAGKSTLAEELSAIYLGAGCDVAVCEADDYFVGGNGYVFNPAWLHRAHVDCQEKFLNSLEQKIDTIIVSNTSSQDWEVDWYKTRAEKFGYLFVSLIVENRHEGKSVHKVPDKSIQRMRDRFDVKL